MSFSDLVRAHHRWDAAEQSPEAPKERVKRTRAEYQDVLERFQDETHSEIVDAYWCRKEASAVALTRTQNDAGRRLRRRPKKEYTLYRVTDWVTRENQRLADLLHHCDILAIKARSSLVGIQERVVMQWLLAIESHVLGFVESEASSAPEQDGKAARSLTPRERKARKEAEERLDDFHRSTLNELSKVEDYYQEAGHKRASLQYVQGMLFLGVPIVLLGAALLAPALMLFYEFEFKSENSRRLYGCILAGALGAVFSVLLRMRRRDFSVDHELGTWGVLWLGAFRPMIGAISGVIVGLVFVADVMPVSDTVDINFYVVMAFVAGFSERWTRVILAGAMRTVEPSEGTKETKRDAPSAGGG